ncbi:hypothetical protein, unlikely [Trypanosoma brucei gambiense DAL972]|uniref:Uncharacterized protein n=1 Tax=Trypanosoma brucei gambiense (strain MHOM/CI/86/DAL972) TaxID=679716 RepID=C9ZL59_TRYB9|nr:hypothetical protein, unlikely [Trypanosoma brucei gambiense DAL972]CBH10068.1 hypothetical protein, unlikely [Trypanosoma brucei gambiense DAL972]|eukprot:XP_011772358.1 hypothetical protein, unlikely [Trypanosoma brucei gambiense DAL972]
MYICMRVHVYVCARNATSKGKGLHFMWLSGGSPIFLLSFLLYFLFVFFSFFLSLYTLYFISLFLFIYLFYFYFFQPYCPCVQVTFRSVPASLLVLFHECLFLFSSCLVSYTNQIFSFSYFHVSMHIPTYMSAAGGNGWKYRRQIMY